ncbi:MAG: G8 domain-containing protein, partial [Patescibacteria group bacterium]
MTDVVRVEVGHTVIVNQDVAVNCLGVHGILKVDTTADRVLKATNYLIYSDGAFEAGTEQNPVPPERRIEIIIADKALDTVDDGIGVFDPKQYGTAFLAFGRVTMHGAVKSPTFARLSQEAKAGDTMLPVEQPATGWQPGDKITLPDTRQLNFNELGSFTPEWEVVGLAGVSADGRTLTLANPLRFNHLGARNMEGGLDLLPHVGNLTRNVRVHSENPAGTRGHVFLTYHADIDIEYAEFEDLGRTTVNSFDDTVLDGNGNATHIGTNQQRRNAFFLRGVAGAPSTQPRFSVIGNSIHNTSASLSRWGIALEESNGGLVKDNIADGIAGAGLIVAGGSDSNVIEHNLMTRLGTGHLQDYAHWAWARPDVTQYTFDIGYDGTGLYEYRSPHNVFRDNVAADAPGAGFAFYSSGQAVLESVRNEAYGPGAVGYSFIGFGTRNYSSTEPDPNVGESVFGGAVIWHRYQKGVALNHANRVTFDGLVIRGDPSQLGNFNNYTTGVAGGYFLGKDITLRNADIQGLRVGYVPSVLAGGGGVQRVENSYFNNIGDIVLTTMDFYSDNAAWFGPRKTILQNVRFGTYAGKLNMIEMYVDPNPRGNIIQRDELFVSDHNGVSGDDFQVFYLEQRPDFIVPKWDENADRTGSPESGLTNQQNWDKYVYVLNPGSGYYEIRLRQPSDPPSAGLAIAGAVSPCIPGDATKCS